MKYTAKEFQRYIAEYAAITVDGVLGTFWSTSEKSLTIKVAGENKSIPLSTIQEVPELDSKKKNVEAFIKYLLEQGATEVPKDDWNGLTRSSGPLLIDYGGRRHNFIFILGHLTEMAGEYYKLAGKKADIKLFTQLLKKYDLSSDCFQHNEPSISFQETTSKIYRLAPVLAALASKPEESPSRETPGSQDNDLLPDMTGFVPARLGAGQHTWLSNNFLLADRDLKEGEKLHAWVIDQADGRVRKQVTWAADKDNLTKDKWPQAFAKAINAKPADSDGSKWLVAGHLAANGGLAINSHATPTTEAFRALTASQRSDLNRLWYYADGCRFYSNAPFSANQVIAARIPDSTPVAGDTLTVQVRDRTTLYLYETYLYEHSGAKATSSASAGLCKRIEERRGSLLRAGVLGSDNITVTPAESRNALWVPQYSELSVEMDALTWQKQPGKITDFTPVAGATVQFHLYDAFSPVEMYGSPFSYTITETDTDAVKCLASLAKALKQSKLKYCLRLGNHASSTATADSLDKWALWLMPLPLRLVVKGLPGLTNAEEPSLETVQGQPLNLGQLYEDYKSGVTLAMADRWNGHTLTSWAFTPSAQQAASLGAWVTGLRAALDSPLIHWGTETVRKDTPDTDAADLAEHTLWLPRDAQLALLADHPVQPVPESDSLPELDPKLTYLSDRLMWEEARAYAGSKRFERGITDYHARYAKLIIWGDEPLVERDRVEIDPGREANRKLDFAEMTYADFEFKIPSANVPALVASALSHEEHVYAQKDVWQLNYRACECLWSNEEQVVLDFKTTDRKQAPSQAYLHLQLAHSARDKGIRFISYTSDFAPDQPASEYAIRELQGTGGLRLNIPVPQALAEDEVLCSASRISRAGISAAPRRQHGVYELEQVAFTLQRPYTGKSFAPADSLCADYAGTLGSEVYDVSGANENGVDPKTGLFHAHYPVGVIRGLAGKGPEVDLTLHYSATRANESALGDGWALRFSAYDNRLHRLTLSTGQTITLTADHVKEATGDKRLAINGITLTGCKGTYDALTEVTIVFPSGRVEKLAKPSTHDDKEASEHYKKAFVGKINKLQENLEQWLKETGITNEQIENINNKLKGLKEMKKDLERKAFILIPQCITSPQGGNLTFAWEGKEGHIHLQSISDGDTQLLKATLGTPTATGEYTSTYTVWPDSDEAYDVTLTIEDCLLTRLTRKGANDTSPVQTVVFGYEGEPVLDRVLCSVAEEDGSLEAVSYAPQWKGWDSGRSPIPLSRVLRHTLLPGAGQAPITHIWQWEGINDQTMQEGGTFSSTCSLDTGGVAMGPFTRRTWALKNGFAVPTEVVEEVPGVVRETTTMTYPDSIASEDPTVKFRLATQPVRTTVSTEDLRTPRTPAPTSAAEPSAEESQS
ncbi:MULTISPECIES: hypothetical protein [unclassified Pseudomonas]|uniref:hypothetical protein n=1 Tax=unclassified Pseudomonas TaxID=196821 RepID=UPI00257E1F18|nr:MULTISPECIES: hypothetical protein [unclassified Pseudomonas]